MLAKTSCRRISVALIFSFACLQINAQWQKTAGPPGMTVQAFCKRGNTLLAGTYLYGVFQSPDNGTTWRSLGNGLRGRIFTTILADSNFLFAGTDSGLYRSADNGKTWQPPGDGIAKGFVNSLAIINRTLFGGFASQGLYKSNDEGTTWISANGGALDHSNIRAITYTASGRIVVVASYYIRYSDDNGNSWSQQNKIPFITGFNCSFFTWGDSLLVTDENKVHRSLDNGVTWSNPIEVSPVWEVAGFGQEDKNVVAGTKDGLYYSENFGKTWKLKATHSIRNDYYKFIYTFYQSSDRYLFGYSNIGVGYSSDKGKTWQYSLQGFAPATSPSEILATTGGAVLSGTVGDGIYRSFNAGDAWTKIGNTDNKDTLANATLGSLYKDKNLLLAGTYDNGLYRSVDNGTTWQHITKGLPAETYPGSFAVRALAKTSGAIIAGTSQGIFYSLDDGVSWLPTNITDYVVDLAANDSVACAVLDNDPNFANLYRSVKNPAVWNYAYGQNGVKWSTIASNGKAHFYASTVSHYNYVSPDNGKTWNLVGTGIPLTAGGNAISAKNNYVFIGNDDGIYFSNNYGASFTKENRGLNQLHTIKSLTQSADYVYAGIGQNSVWKRPLSDFGIQPLEEQRITNPIAVTLSPNPLRSRSLLSYTLEKSGRVSIGLYNANGNFIKTLREADEEKGMHTITINKGVLQNGNYFIAVKSFDGEGSVNVVVSGD